MTIAEKLTTIAKNEQKVFEAGKEAERDAFWDKFQDYGNREHYYYAFSYYNFTDETFTPKYTIKTGTTNTGGQCLFYSSHGITDTKVPIHFPKTARSAFYGAKSMRFIREIVVNESTDFTGTFSSCESLEELTVSGEIGTDVNLQWSKLLNKASITSVMRTLSDTTIGKTLTLSEAAVDIAFPHEELLDLPVKIEDRDGLRFAWNGQSGIVVNGIADKDVMFSLESPPCADESDIYELSVEGYTGDNCTYIVGNYASSATEGIGMIYPIKKGEAASIHLLINEGTTLNNAVIMPSISHRTGGWGKLVNDKSNWTVVLA